MCQQPAAALCTEFVKRVGETIGAGAASASHSAWQLLPSPLLDVNTVASVAGSTCASATASSATASASLIAAPARRRSAAGRRTGIGSTVGSVAGVAAPRSTACAPAHESRPGPSRPTPSIQTCSAVMTAPRPTGTSADPPRGRART